MEFSDEKRAEGLRGTMKVEGRISEESSELVSPEKTSFLTGAAAGDKSRIGDKTGNITEIRDEEPMPMFRVTGARQEEIEERKLPVFA